MPTAPGSDESGMNVRRRRSPTYVTHGRSARPPTGRTAAGLTIQVDPPSRVVAVVAPATVLWTNVHASAAERATTQSPPARGSGSAARVRHVIPASVDAYM
jgi:hypothetical protein